MQDRLALTRIFSVIMYYHFAFLAISIALFGLSASGVYVFVFRRALDRHVLREITLPATAAELRTRIARARKTTARTP